MNNYYLQHTGGLSGSRNRWKYHHNRKTVLIRVYADDADFIKSRSCRGIATQADVVHSFCLASLLTSQKKNDIILS